jgi:hypothetical protein
MLIEIIVGVSSFLGGAILSAGLYEFYNYWSEERELRRRTETLYLEFLNN